MSCEVPGWKFWLSGIFNYTLHQRLIGNRRIEIGERDDGNSREINFARVDYDRLSAVKNNSSRSVFDD